MYLEESRIKTIQSARYIKPLKQFSEIMEDYFTRINT